MIIADLQESQVGANTDSKSEDGTTLADLTETGYEHTSLPLKTNDTFYFPEKGEVENILVENSSVLTAKVDPEKPNFIKFETFGVKDKTRVSVIFKDKPRRNFNISVG